TALFSGHGTEEVPTPEALLVQASCSFSESHPTTISAPFTVTNAFTTTTASTTPTTAAPTTTTAAPGFTPPATPPAGATPLGNPPAAVVPGGTVPVDEDGFVAGEQVPIVLYSTPVVLATATADAQGRVQATVT